MHRHAEGRDGEDADDRDGCGQRGRRVAYDRGEDAAADPAGADAPVEPPEQRHPRPVDPAAERDQQCGEHRDRPDDRHRDHDDRAEREGVEGDDVDQEEARHGRCHRETGDHDRVARGLGGDLDGVEGGAAAGAFLALALEVEQRVVDADGHPDQHDHRVHRGLGGHEVGRGRGDAHGRRHAAERQEDRDAGRDERTEGEQHEQEGHRQADPLRGGQVVGDLVVDVPVRGEVARLPDREVRMVRGDGGGHGLQRRGVLDALLQRHRDEHRGPGVVPHRGVDLGDAVGVGHPGDDLLRRARQVGTADPVSRVALEQHHLARRRRQARLLGHRVGPTGLPDAVVGLLRLLGGDEDGQARGSHHEDQPGEDRAPRVLGAPARGPLRDPGDQVGGHGRAPFGGWWGRPPTSRRAADGAAGAPPEPEWGQPHRAERADP